TKPVMLPVGDAITHTVHIKDNRHRRIPLNMYLVMEFISLQTRDIHISARYESRNPSLPAQPSVQLDDARGGALQAAERRTVDIDVQAARISMVEHVKHVGAELQFDALVNGEVFGQTKIQAPRSRTSHRARADSPRPQRNARSRSHGDFGESRL